MGKFLRCIGLAGLVVMSIGCGPAGRASGDSDQSPERPKVLTLAMSVEPSHFNQLFTGFVTPTGGGKVPLGIAHNYLVIDSGGGSFVPQLASELISVERGTWRTNSDGTMDTIWKLRPNVKWHDGAPFTSADLLFTLETYKHPDSPARQDLVGRIQSATAPDPLTFAIHWSSVYVHAEQAVDLDPLPKHLLEGLQQTDIGNLDKSPVLSTEFVGLGPYRLVNWERGSYMEFARFNDYFLGRPPLSTVTARFVADKNAVSANVLAGALDVVPPRILAPDDAAEIQKRWAGSQNRVQYVVSRGAYETLQVQHRSEYARPSNGLTNQSVRRALSHALDRSFVETLSLGTVADSWIPPNDELRAQLDPSIPKYPFDLVRSQQLLSEAGWVRGADEALVHRQTGERFTTQISYQPTRANEAVASVIADQWKRVGVELNLAPIPAALLNDRELFATIPGVRQHSVRSQVQETSYHHTSTIPTAANRWVGDNRTGYSSPRVDALLDKLVVTINATERLALRKELLMEEGGDVADIPLYWRADIWLAIEGIQGIRDDGETWNMFDWNRN